MSSFRSLAALGLLALSCTVCSAQGARFEGVGRAATPAEVKAWDIDVRPDFKGLPPGQGSVKRGEQIWEAQCASCHGTFGESNDVFTPIVGYTTPRDVQAGRVAALMPGANAPTRSTLMKVAHLSTLWDYIRRAMPWTAPKTLSDDDVYAVTAFILNLGGVVPDDFTLSDKNMRETQARLPNRDGMTTAHGLWPGTELGGAARPDVQGSSCMRDCKTDPKVTSLIPEYARNAHGNLAEQVRGLGPTRGADTTQPAATRFAGRAVAPAAVPAAASAAPPADAAEPPRAAQVQPVLQKNVCVACHAMDSKLVGPSFKDIAAKYRGQADAAGYLAGKIRSGGQGVWGAIPMPPQSIGEADAKRLAQWLAQGAAP
jgi:S-disulfanyl-L-cysteine oxidoreductase SoxD